MSDDWTISRRALLKATGATGLGAAAGTAKPTTIDYSVVVPSTEPGDQFNMVIENTGGSTDLDVLVGNLDLVEV